MTFRRKSWQRVAGKCDRLVARYAPGSLQFTDNILANEYLRDLLPYWKSTGDSTPKFFEVNSNLTRPRISLMRDAGIPCAQAGIESLSDPMLALMGKGVSAAQNVAVLGWFAEHDILTNWNVLLGFPGESAAEIEQQCEVLRKIVHLDPPAFCGVIRLDRFSPNFTSWREFGFSSIRSMPAYRHIFDMPPERLVDVTYFFEFQHPGLAASIDAARPMMALCDLWREREALRHRRELELFPHFAGGSVAVDRRMGRWESSWRLDPTDEAWMLACDAPIAPAAASALLEQSTALGRGRPLGESLERLLEAGFIAEAGLRLVTLAVMRDSIRAILGTDIGSGLTPATHYERWTEWLTT